MNAYDNGSFPSLTAFDPTAPRITDKRAAAYINGHGTPTNGQTLTHANGHDLAVPAQRTSGTFAQEVASLAQVPSPPGLHSRDQATLTAQRNLLSTIGSYTWFSKENEAYARTAFDGALAAASYQQAQGVVFTINAIIDLYHTDRAEHAGHVVGTRPMRSTDVPTHPKGKPHLRLQLQPLGNWPQGTPYEVLKPLTKILTQVPPDQLQLATYHRPPPPQPQPSYTSYIDDPIIYALYGSWYVQVAQWD